MEGSKLVPINICGQNRKKVFWAVMEELSLSEYNRRLEASRLARGPFYQDAMGALQVLDGRSVPDAQNTGRTVETEALRRLRGAMDEKKFGEALLESLEQREPLAVPGGKKCQKCFVWGSKTELCFCQRCKDAYHPLCASPQLKSVPDVYVCHRCVKCKACGTLESPSWWEDFEICAKCQQRQRRGEHCAVCLLPDQPDDAAVKCSSCLKWVHANGRCALVSEELWNALNSGAQTYVCSVCTAVQAGSTKEERDRKRYRELDLQTLAFLPSGPLQMCTVEGCGQGFPSQDDLVAHRVAVHETGRRARAGRARRERTVSTYSGDEDSIEVNDMDDEEFDAMLDDMQTTRSSRSKRNQDD